MALVFLGSVTAALIIAQAWLLADVIAAALAASVALVVLLIVVLARAVAAWGHEVLAD